MNRYQLKKLAEILLPEKWVEPLSYYVNEKLAQKPVAKRKCPICHYEGWFRRLRLELDAYCPKCNSVPRHRLLYMAIQRNLLGRELNKNTDLVLHFAPEKPLEVKFREIFGNYKTADNFAKADLSIDIESMSLPDLSYDIIIANHVLEHVDDMKACSEINRVLTDDGIFICMVPIVEGWDQTYENNDVTDSRGRLLHFGHNDHKRYYGRDLRKRFENVGLVLRTEITSGPEDAVKYGLQKGEKVFVFSKTLN